MSTLAFTVCFAVWMMFAVIGIPIKTQLGLNETQFGILIATPVLTGSLIRLPLGMWTDKFGGRIVFFFLMLSTVGPIWLMEFATEFWHFLTIGLFVGMAGGSFSVGIAYCARWYEKERQGMAMGVFGAGNSGAAVTKLVAPAIVMAYGWTMVPQVYAAAMLVTAILFWFFTYDDPAHKVPSHVTVREQLKALKDPVVWKYCQYYSIVFGGYVALALWMTKYYVTEYGFDLKTAAFLAACFSLPGGVLRAVGGWMSDKWGAHRVTWWVLWVSWICLFIMSYPETEFTVKTVNRPADLQHPPRPGNLHRPAVHRRRRLRLRQGQRVQVHLRRVPPQHRRHLRHRRPDRRPGRLPAADHVRRPGRPHRHPLLGLHADVRRGLGVADLDVHHRGSQAGPDQETAPGRSRHPRITPATENAQ
jgi:NNP family nitrate/nitrite transporter-like MFS transporter